MATKSTSVVVPMGRRMTAWWMTGPAMRPDNPFVWRPPTNVYETGGSFRSDVELPWPVNVDAVRAAYRHGFIFVELSRAQDGSP